MGNCQTVQSVHDRHDFAKQDIISGGKERKSSRARIPKLGKMKDDTSMTTADANRSIVSSIERRRENELFESYSKAELCHIDFHCSTLMGALKESERLRKPILCFDIDLSTNDDSLMPQNVFTHPLLIEAIESLFISLQQGLEIGSYIDKPYADRKTRVRMLNESGAEIVAGIKGKQINLASMTSMIVAGLKALRKEVPKYLSLLETEENGKIRHLPDGTMQRIDRKVVFGMSDSKIGEIEFADLEGVLATKAGYVSQQRAVRVTYDSKTLSFCNLVRFSLQRQVSDIIYYQSNEERIAARIEVERVKGGNELIQHLGTIQVDVNPKHSLGQTMLRYVPLTELQALRANNLASRGVFNEATHLLSPRQGLILMKSIQNAKKSHIPDLIDVPITLAWKKRQQDGSEVDPNHIHVIPGSA